MLTRAQVLVGLPKVPRILVCCLQAVGAGAGEHLVAADMERVHPHAEVELVLSLSACSAMYLLHAIQAASRSSLDTFSFSQRPRRTAATTNRAPSWTPAPRGRRGVLVPPSSRLNGRRGRLHLGAAGLAGISARQGGRDRWRPAARVPTAAPSGNGREDRGERCELEQSTGALGIGRVHWPGILWIERQFCLYENAWRIPTLRVGPDRGKMYSDSISLI